MNTLNTESNFRHHVLYYYNRFASLYDLGEFIRKGTRHKAMSFSGMETILSLALGILTVLAYRWERWKTLGVVLGLMMLTRPEA